MFTLLPRALKAAACFLAVCKIELVMVGESDLLLDLLHIFPQILAFLVCVCACACVFSAVSVISHHAHAVISIFTISSISALHPTQFHTGTPPPAPLPNPSLSPLLAIGRSPPHSLIWDPVWPRRSRVGAEEVHPWKKMLHTEGRVQLSSLISSRSTSDLHN